MHESESLQGVSADHCVIGVSGAPSREPVIAIQDCQTGADRVDRRVLLEIPDLSFDTRRVAHVIGIHAREKPASGYAGDLVQSYRQTSVHPITESANARIGKLLDRR